MLPWNLIYEVKLIFCKKKDVSASEMYYNNNKSKGWREMPWAGRAYSLSLTIRMIVLNEAAEKTLGFTVRLHHEHQSSLLKMLHGYTILVYKHHSQNLLCTLFSFWDGFLLSLSCKKNLLPFVNNFSGGIDVSNHVYLAVARLWLNYWS